MLGENGCIPALTFEIDGDLGPDGHGDLVVVGLAGHVATEVGSARRKCAALCL